MCIVICFVQCTTVHQTVEEPWKMAKSEKKWRIQTFYRAWGFKLNLKSVWDRPWAGPRQGSNGVKIDGDKNLLFELFVAPKRAFLFDP